MEQALQQAVERLIAERTGQPAVLADVAGRSGGCISRATAVELADGRRFFVKSNPDPLPQMFEREAEGLAALAEVGAIRVPRALGTGGGTAGLPSFIVMELVVEGTPRADFSAGFGTALAELHRRSTADRFGFTHDNYLGSTRQPNGWSQSWVEFWRERRLGFQLRLARERGLASAELDRLGDRLAARLGQLIDQPDEPPCLLHGDLWGGNYLVGEGGEPVLIDPAAYHGRREADLAMTMLFGGFDARFYRAYEQTWPLAPGSDERLEVYKLYHLLNHLNLFGSSYLGGCLAILRRLA